MYPQEFASFHFTFSLIKTSPPFYFHLISFIYLSYYRIASYKEHMDVKEGLDCRSIVTSWSLSDITRPLKLPGPDHASAMR